MRVRAVYERRFGVPRFLPGAGVYVCECGRADCMEPIRMRAKEYAEVRKHPTRFVVLPDHVNPEVEVVVARLPRWDVVEKIGEAGRIARKQAPPDEPR